MPVVCCYVWGVPRSFYGRLFPCLTPVLAHRCLVNEDDREVPSFLFESVEPGFRTSQVVNSVTAYEIMEDAQETSELDYVNRGLPKSTSTWGVEARVPFLDKEFINVVMSIDPEMKMIDMEKNRIEKWILRKAFDDEDHPYLPKRILYRQKEQFSDGVGYSWIDGLKDHAELHVRRFMFLLANDTLYYFI
ncbi:putative asparagine synthase (glutamine-hydrolyzing) [Helianthus annuus]|nr:putative asparagine synthase (glutamine-hydrolyzing) [Helianthus annuus]